VLSPTQEWELLGLEFLWPRFFFFDTVLLEDSSRGVSSTIVVRASWSIFFRRSLFFGTSKILITSLALDEAPSYERSCTLGFFQRRLRRRMTFLFLRCGIFSLLGGFFGFRLGLGLRTYIIIFSFISSSQRYSCTHIDAKISSIFSIKYYTVCSETKESILPMPIGEMISM